MRVEKGVDLFLRAFARIPEPRPLAVLVGDGADMESARALTSKLAIEGDVHFAGEMANAGVLLRAFDAVAISSRSEGLPMVLLEAMGAGVPVVSFAVGGIPDAMDEKTGWLVPPGDLDGLSAAIHQVITNPAEVARRTAAAGALVRERYGSGPWGERIYAIHEEVAARKQR